MHYHILLFGRHRDAEAVEDAGEVAQRAVDGLGLRGVALLFEHPILGRHFQDAAAVIEVFLSEALGTLFGGGAEVDEEALDAVEGLLELAFAEFMVADKPNGVGVGQQPGGLGRGLKMGERAHIDQQDGHFLAGFRRGLGRVRLRGRGFPPKHVPQAWVGRPVAAGLPRVCGVSRAGISTASPAGSPAGRTVRARP
jgi:hypothetical protein